MKDAQSSRTARGRLGMAAGLVLAVLVGFAGASAAGVGGTVGPQSTDAAWISEETGTLSASAGSVARPETVCEGHNGAPNLLRLAEPDEGLPVSGYLVTISVEGGDAPDGWASGESSEGHPYVPANTPTYLPASTSTVAWGISGGWNTTWTGDVTVEAVGPGGWTSQPVTHSWSIGFDLVGGGYGSCS